MDCDSHVPPENCLPNLMVQSFSSMFFHGCTDVGCTFVSGITGKLALPPVRPPDSTVAWCAKELRGGGAFLESVVYLALSVACV